MSGEIKLTIAIPTYNGEKHLKDTLESILCQINDNLRNRVDILVSDNASNDNSSVIVSEYSRMYPGTIKYSKNEKNIGAENNFDIAVKSSSGEYVWLLSDDDKLVKGSIDKIIEVLDANNDLSALFVNWLLCNDNLSNISEPHLKIEDDIFFEDSNEYLKVLKYLPMLVSSNIFKRKLWESVDTEKYYNSGWIHYITLLHVISGRKSCCIARPCVLYRMNNDRWDKSGNVSLLNTVKMIKLMDELPALGYRPDIVKSQKDFLVSKLPSSIYDIKLKGNLFDFKLLLKLTFCFRGYISFWLICVPLYISPIFILAFLSKIKNKIFNKSLKYNAK